MRALVLSGGKGTRLRPITYTSAKQLVPIANKPILFYGIEAIAEAGIKEIGIVVGDTKDEVRTMVGNGAAWDVNITYIEQEAPLGLAHAVKISEDFLGDDPFVMYLGDNLIKSGITQFVEEFKASKADAQILLAHVPNPSAFGVAVLKGNRIERLIEKPKNPPTDLAMVGVYLFNKSIFKAVNAIKPSVRNELEITDAVQWLIDHKAKVVPHIIEGWWKDTGRLDDLLEANRIMLEGIETLIEGTIDDNSNIHGRIIIGTNTKISNSTIRGPVIIGDDCVIEGSFIGPFTSIQNNVVIEKSELEHSIVLSDSSLIMFPGRIDCSLIGRKVKLCSSNEKPLSHQLMVGDNSEIIVAG